jgi:hypothetical protein
MPTPPELITESLAFFLEHITSIEWVRGERACLVAHAHTYYEGSNVDRGPAVSTVTLDAMDAACPSFERCINCALVLTEKFQDRGPANAALIIGWARALVGNKKPMRTFIASDQVACSWSALLNHGGALQSMLDGEDDADSIVYSSEMLDANLPGFLKIYRALCIENSIAANDGLWFLHELAGEVPYQMLQYATDRIVGRIRTLAPIGIDSEALRAAVAADLLGSSEAEELPQLETANFTGVDR